MKIGTAERSILAAAQLYADDSVAAIAKRTGLSTSAVNYHLSKLREGRFIRRVVCLDVAMLGFTQYLTYFSISQEEDALIEKILDFVALHPRIAWVASLSGSYQGAFTFCGRHPAEVRLFIDQLQVATGARFVSKVTSVLTEFRIFPKKYLDVKVVKPEAIHLGTVMDTVALDENDRKLLAHITSDAGMSNPELSRLTGIPRTTVDFRLARLHKDGVIKRNIYQINARKLGFLTYKVLIYGAGPIGTLEELLGEVCLRHPNVVSLSSCLGPWDFELTVEVQDAKDAPAVTRAIVANTKKQITRFELLSVFEQAQSSKFMGDLWGNPAKGAGSKSVDSKSAPKKSATKEGNRVVGNTKNAKATTAGTAKTKVGHPKRRTT